MNIKKCDRCGNPYEISGDIKIIMRMRKKEATISRILATVKMDTLSFTEQTDIDLCPECRSDFVTWWNAMEGRYSENE